MQIHLMTKALEKILLSWHIYRIKMKIFKFIHKSTLWFWAAWNMRYGPWPHCKARKAIKSLGDKKQPSSKFWQWNLRPKSHNVTQVYRLFNQNMAWKDTKYTNTAALVLFLNWKKHKQKGFDLILCIVKHESSADGLCELMTRLCLDIVFLFYLHCTSV